MKFPLYLYYELLNLVAEFEPNAGHYLSIMETQNYVLIKTTTDQLEVSRTLLFKQFNDPHQISRAELQNLAEKFQLAGRLYNLL